MKESLQIIVRELAKNILVEFWECFLKLLDEKFTNKILKANYFVSPNQAEQVRFDMEALFSVISLFNASFTPSAFLPKFVFFLLFFHPLLVLMLDKQN